MRAILILVLYLSLNVTVHAGARKFNIDSEKEKNNAKRELLSVIPPLLPEVLVEIGMSKEDAVDFRNEHKSLLKTYISRDVQIEQGYLEAQRVLAAIPPQYSNEFKRLTYQWAGPISLLREEVAQAIALTTEQQEKVQAVCFDYYERLAPINRSDFSYQMTKEDWARYNKRTRQIENQRDLALLDLLTPEQLNMWKLMVGDKSAALDNFRRYCDNPRTTE